MEHTNNTAALRLLNSKKIPYKLLEYNYKESSAGIGVTAAHELGIDPSRVYKTIVLDNGFVRVICALPSNKNIALGKLAKFFNQKTKFKLMEPKAAEKFTGYHVGGISIIGTRTDLTRCIHKLPDDLDRVILNAGHKGLMMEIKISDLMLAGEIITADLCE